VHVGWLGASLRIPEKSGEFYMQTVLTPYPAAMPTTFAELPRARIRPGYPTPGAQSSPGVETPAVGVATQRPLRAPLQGRNALHVLI
jgi:hypothetical protein